MSDFAFPAILSDDELVAAFSAGREAADTKGLGLSYTQAMDYLDLAGYRAVEQRVLAALAARVELEALDARQMRARCAELEAERDALSRERGDGWAALTNYRQEVTRASLQMLDERDGALRLIRECIADLDDDDGHGCPGHDHQVARVWDDTGEPCEACTRWDALRALLREGA